MMLRRRFPSYCPVCLKTHSSEHSTIIILPSKILIKCFRNKSDVITINKKEEDKVKISKKEKFDNFMKKNVKKLLENVNIIKDYIFNGQDNYAEIMLEKITKEFFQNVFKNDDKKNLFIQSQMKSGKTTMFFDYLNNLIGSNNSGIINDSKYDIINVPTGGIKSGIIHGIMNDIKKGVKIIYPSCRKILAQEKYELIKAKFKNLTPYIYTENGFYDMIADPSKNGIFFIQFESLHKL